MRMRFGIAALMAAMSVTPALAAEKKDLSSALAAIKSVGREGAGNEAAAVAWKAVVSAGGEALLPTLTAFDDASPTAANWLRSAVDAIIEVEKTAGRKLPVDEISGFVKDTKRNPSARRIAFELYSKLDPTASEMLPKMIDDPSLEIRRDAIAARIPLVKKVAGEDKEKEKAELLTLFKAARDLDQVEDLATSYTKLGGKLDLIQHYGFVLNWRIVGPFDNTDGKGFDKPNPPEAGVAINAEYTSKDGKKVGWKAVAAESKLEGKDKTYATIDLNAQLGKFKFATGYAYAVVESEKEQSVDLRAASQNSLVIFLNGKMVYSKDEYHHGTRMDQHACQATLKPGKNEILVKVCQNDQKESWAQAWTLQLRICDHLGGPVAFTQPAAK